MLRLFGLALLAGLAVCSTLGVWAAVYDWHPLGRVWYYWSFAGIFGVAEFTLYFHLAADKSLPERDRRAWSHQMAFGIWACVVPFIYMLRRDRRLNSRASRRHGS